jgi:hypothetical protein
MQKRYAASGFDSNRIGGGWPSSVRKIQTDLPHFPPVHPFPINSSDQPFFRSASVPRLQLITAIDGPTLVYSECVGFD